MTAYRVSGGGEAHGVEGGMDFEYAAYQVAKLAARGAEVRACAVGRRGDRPLTQPETRELAEAAAQHPLSRARTSGGRG